MTQGIMKRVRFHDTESWKAEHVEQYVTLSPEEEAAFTVHTEDMTGYDVYLQPIEGGGAFEPVAKTWVSELDKHVIIYERART